MDNKCRLKSQEQGLQSLSDHGTLQGLKSLFLNDMVMDNKLSGIQDLCQHFWRSYDGWRELVDFAASFKTPVMLENTYERTPAQLKRMLTALDSDYARFCFDVGHVLAFAKNSWQDWLPELAPWLGQIHLHE